MPDPKQPKADFSDVESGSSSTAPAPSGRSYTVVKGDSLSKIAKHLYGDAQQWRKSTTRIATRSRIRTSSIRVRPSPFPTPDPGQEACSCARYAAGSICW